MKLEEEIHQKRFSSPEHKLSVNLIYTYNWVNTRSASTFKTHGITSQQYNILRILRGQHPNPATIQLLKDRMLDKQSDVSRLIDRLVLKKLVERTPCEKDRRKMDVVITQAGLDLLMKMDPAVSETNNIFKNLTTEELNQLNDLLDKLRG